MRKPELPEETERKPSATDPDNASQRGQSVSEPRQNHVQKREVTMSDGRYLIYFTFPGIDQEFDALRIDDATHTRKR